MPASQSSGATLLNMVYCEYRYRCKRKSTPWLLSKRELWNLMLQNCHYCKSPPSNVRIKKAGKELRSVKYNGIDRKENSLGYSPKNCVPCCKTCNSIKGEHLSYDEMILVMRSLLSYRGSLTSSPTSS